MAQIVDARGLSWPQPVLMTMEEIEKSGKREIEILVDTDTSKENVNRAATSKGWQIQNVAEEGSGYRIVIKKDA